MHQLLRAEVSDAAAILELQKLAYQSEAILYDDWHIPPLTQTLPEIEKEFIEKTFLKVVDSGRLIGSVRASIHDYTCEVGRLIVHPGSQHQGIGSQLLLAVEAEFSLARRFELFTGSRSEGNIRLYERLGYVPFHTERVSAKIVLVFMEKWRK
jgi:GNAT superfamily N-acetyltransferase